MSTEHHVHELDERLRNDGVVVEAVLLKPVTPSRLHDALQSSLGKRFPVAATVRQAVGAIGSPSPRSSANGNGSHKRVLLVEDNEINRELVLAIVEPLEIEIIQATNGAEALDQLELENFDLVLMDCQMPVMEGFVATEHIRRSSRWQKLPIIAMTAHAMSGDRERVLAAGMKTMSASRSTSTLF